MLGDIMSVELREVLSVCTKIRNGNSDSGAHYLLGYLWAGISDTQKARILKSFQKDLEEMEK